MKSLSAHRRFTASFFLGLGCMALTISLCLIFMFQPHTTSPVGNVAHLFVADPMANRPMISSVAPVQPVSNIPVSPTDDAAISVAVAKTAAAQSVTAGSEVSYPSLQITPSQRDRLLVVALSVMVIGGSLFAMTLFDVPSPGVVTRRPFYKAFDS